MSRTAQLALATHVEDLGSVLGCLIHTRPEWRCFDVRIHAGSTVGVVLPNDEPVRLRLRRYQQDVPLWLALSQTVVVQQRIDRSWYVSLDSYAYQLFRGDGSSRFDEVVTYHWTPNDPHAKRAWPHLHIGSTLVDPEARREPWTFHKTHLATGPMTANAFVRMAVEEFGVQPVVPDWERRIADPVGHA